MQYNRAENQLYQYAWHYCPNRYCSLIQFLAYLNTILQLIPSVCSSARNPTSVFVFFLVILFPPALSLWLARCTATAIRSKSVVTFWRCAKEKVTCVSVFTNLNKQCSTHWIWNVPSQLAKEVLDICWWDWFNSSKKRGKQKIHFEAWSKYDGRCYHIAKYGLLPALVMFPVTKLLKDSSVLIHWMSFLVFIYSWN